MIVHGLYHIRMQKMCGGGTEEKKNYFAIISSPRIAIPIFCPPPPPTHVYKQCISITVHLHTHTRTVPTHFTTLPPGRHPFSYILHLRMGENWGSKKVTCMGSMLAV